MYPVGFIGLGKLGLPCAAALSTKTNRRVYGYDLNPAIQSYVAEKRVPYMEANIEEYLTTADLVLMPSIQDVVDKTDLVFVAVQTPHEKEYEGITPLPDTRKDFDYSHLISCLQSIRDAVLALGNKKITVVVISTVLPGTVSKHLLPIFQDTNVSLIYNPYFIAMGTTIPDFLNPEFIVMGTENIDEAHRLKDLYQHIVGPATNIAIVRYEEAELIKVSYNTFIGLKIIFANTLAEITSKIGGNVDIVTHTLASANRRIISPKYMSAGMGDGGGCHPRDQIAMSHLAKELNLSFDLFEMVANARDAHTLRHAELIKYHAEARKYPVIILGKAYKKDVNLTVGSPSLLLQHYLDKLQVEYTVIDPVVDGPSDIVFTGPAVFYVATPHSIFKDFFLPLDSLVLDPWGDTITPQYSIHTIHIGRYTWG